MSKAHLSGASTTAFVLFSALAMASVENSHHDMRLFNLSENKGACVYCHVPQRAESDYGLFERKGTADELGPMGSFCYSCHDGTVVPTALIEASDGSVGIEALKKSHGYEISRLVEVTAGLETDQNVYASGLVDISDPSSLPTRIDCDACHDPHQDQYPPFLRAPFEKLCQSCHSGQDRQGKGRWTKVETTGEDNMAHSIGMPVKESEHDRTRGLPSEMSFHGPEAVFDVPTRSAEELKDIFSHWEMGGHLFGSQKEVSCGTCHSAHLPSENLLVAEAGKTPDIVLCSGCHGDVVNLENPGATQGYHPVYDSSLPPYIHDHSTHEEYVGVPTTGYIDLFVEIPAEWPIDSEGKLYCITCHRAHGGRQGAKALRAGPKGKPLICDECHGVGQQEYPANRHHPTGDIDYSTWGFDTITAWYEGPGLPGDLTDGLQCTDCHSDWAKSAHNW